MSELPLHRHGLESCLAASPDEVGDSDRFAIELLPDLGHINLRGDPKDPNFIAAVQSILGQDFPIVENTMTKGVHRVYWLGPNEWLLISPIERTGALMAQLREELAAHRASATDVSGGQILLRLTGPGVRSVLEKGCTLDFHPQEFAIGACAQSGLAKANILIGLVDDKPIFEIIVRRSFSEYVVDWLTHSQNEQGPTIRIR